MSHVTNVRTGHYWTHYWGLTNFKKSQLDDNRRDILNALSVLAEAQVEQIYALVLKINHEEAQRLYENGMISGSEKKEFIKENTISKRTIHRHLDILRKLGLVEHIGYKYRLADKVKNDMIYWSRQFGDSLLYRLMSRYFPYTFSFEQNIEELIKIFGIYVVSCLVEAARPPTDNNDTRLSKTDLLNRDRLVLSWIKEVFNPQRMLEYLVAIMNNLHEEKGRNFRSGKASDIRSERWMTFLLTSEKLSFYDIAKKPYYGLDIGIINKIMQVLEKKYNTYYKLLIELTKNYDITEMTKNSEMNLAKWLSLNTENVPFK